MEENNCKPSKIAIIGGGSWATALVKIISENNIRINWWLRNQKDIDHILKYHHNPSYLSNVKLNLDRVFPSSDLHAQIDDAEIVILAVPAAFLKEVLDSLKPDQLSGKIIVSAIKGMIPDENLLITEYVEKNFNVSRDKLCVIAGPCHSEEVAMEKRSYLTIAGFDKKNSLCVAHILTCRYVKVSFVDDLYGVEYCAIMKNIIAIACGVARGLNYGDNFQAVLVSNSMSEISHLLDQMFPQNRNLNHSAYLGDLLVTSYSQFSRNRTLGNMVGRGYTVKSAQMEMKMVAEGYYAVKCIYELAQNSKIQMPVVKAVYNILYEKISPSIEMRILEDIMS